MASNDSQTGVQSFEVGMALFGHLLRLRRPVSLSELAESSGMHPSKAHRYLVSMVRTGLVTRTGRGSYRVGPFAAQLALSGVLQNVALELAEVHLDALVQQVDETIFLTSWGVNAPYLAKVVERHKPFAMRPTSTGELPLWNSSSSRVFLANMPPARVEQLIDAEIERDRANGLSKAEAAKRRKYALEEIELTRQRGMARTTGERQHNLVSFAAPIFDANGHVALVVAAVAHQASISTDWDGPTPAAVKAFAARVTEELRAATSQGPGAPAGA